MGTELSGELSVLKVNIRNKVLVKLDFLNLGNGENGGKVKCNGVAGGVVNTDNGALAVLNCLTAEVIMRSSEMVTKLPLTGRVPSLTTPLMAFIVVLKA